MSDAVFPAPSNGIPFVMLSRIHFSQHATCRYVEDNIYTWPGKQLYFTSIGFWSYPREENARVSFFIKTSWRYLPFCTTPYVVAKNVVRENSTALWLKQYDNPVLYAFSI